jgi:hypothetical protein
MAYKPKSFFAWLNRERYEMDRKAEKAAESKIKATPEFKIRNILADVLGFKGTDARYAKLAGFMRNYKASVLQDVRNHMVYLFKREMRFYIGASDKDIKTVYRELLTVV